MNESCHIRVLATVCALLRQKCTCEGVFIVVTTLCSRRTWLSYVISLWSDRRANPMAMRSFHSSASIPSFVRWPPLLIPTTHTHIFMYVCLYMYIHICLYTWLPHHNHCFLFPPANPSYQIIKDGHLPSERGKETWDLHGVRRSATNPGERQRCTAWWARHSEDTANDYLVQTCLY